MTSFNESQLQERISRTWDESIVPSMVEYIKIPNKSPSFEPGWEELGHMEQALQLDSSGPKAICLERHKFRSRDPQAAPHCC